MRKVAFFYIITNIYSSKICQKTNFATRGLEVLGKCNHPHRPIDQESLLLLFVKEIIDFFGTHFLKWKNLCLEIEHLKVKISTLDLEILVHLLCPGNLFFHRTFQTKVILLILFTHQTFFDNIILCILFIELFDNSFLGYN